jgi:hypothetical protein
MKKDADDRPMIGQAGRTLGIRPGEVDLDTEGFVLVNGKGMSVSPEWRVAPIFLIPKRLGTGGRGSNSWYCFAEEPGYSSRIHAGPDCNFYRIVQHTVLFDRLNQFFWRSTRLISMLPGWNGRWTRRD